MIISRVPLRVSLMGGGTDIPAVYKSIGGGATVGFSINKFMYLSMHNFSEPHFRFKYSQVEDCRSSFELRHDLAREVFKATGLNLSGCECASLCDVPSGTGLGSSSAFTVGLLKALNRHSMVGMSNFDLAAQACDVEITRAKSPIGKQDQHLCALGGVNQLNFASNGTVTVKPFPDSSAFAEGILKYARLYRVGSSRSASNILAGTAHQSLTPVELDRYRQLVEKVDEMVDAASNMDFRRVGRLLLRSWELKCAMNPSDKNNKADSLIQAAVGAGAFGGKLLGAGEAGFAFILAENHARVKQAVGLEGIPIGIDFQGATIVLDDRNEITNDGQPSGRQ